MLMVTDRSPLSALWIAALVLSSIPADVDALSGRAAFTFSRRRREKSARVIKSVQGSSAGLGPPSQWRDKWHRASPPPRTLGALHLLKPVFSRSHLWIYNSCSDDCNGARSRNKNKDINCTGPTVAARIYQQLTPCQLSAVWISLFSLLVVRIRR